VAAVGIALVVGMQGAPTPEYDGEFAAGSAEYAALAPAPVPAPASTQEPPAEAPTPAANVYCDEGKWVEDGACVGCPLGLKFIQGNNFFMNALGRSVTIGYDYCFGIGETSNPTYSKLTKQSPSSNNGYTYPVENVTFDEALEFANARSADENLRPCYLGGQIDLSCNGYRLPSEAEWEFAAKTSTAWQPLLPGQDGAPWTWENAYGSSQVSSIPSRQKTQPNPWGIYDTLGNVAEYVTKMEGCSTDAGVFVTAPTSTPAESGGNVVVRGGSVKDSYVGAQVSERITIEGGGQWRYPWLGIRIVRNIPATLPSPQVIAGMCSSGVGTIAMP
jgi:hypothetical protein